MRAFRDSVIAGELLQPGPVVAVADQHERGVRRRFQDARQGGDQRVRAFVLFGAIPAADGQDFPAHLGESRWRRWRDSYRDARFEFRVESPGEPPHLGGRNPLIGNEMLHGVRARPDDQTRAAQRRPSRPAQRLPHFDAVGENDRPEFPAARAHGPHDRSEMRVQGNHKVRLASRRAQRRPNKLSLAPRIPGNGKLQRADVNGVQSLRIVEAQEARGHPAIRGQLCSHRGNVAPGALNAARRQHIREQSHDGAHLSDTVYARAHLPSQSQLENRRGSRGFRWRRLQPVGVCCGGFDRALTNPPQAEACATRSRTASAGNAC